MAVTVVVQSKAAKGSPAVINSFQKVKAYCTLSLSQNGKIIFNSGLPWIWIWMDIHWHILAEW